MAKFSYYAGTQPINTDTVWSLWAKILIKFCQLKGSQQYLPSGVDTRRQLIEKVLKTINL